MLFILQVTEKILMYLLNCVDKDKERYDSVAIKGGYCTVLYLIKHIELPVVLNLIHQKLNNFL